MHTMTDEQAERQLDRAEHIFDAVSARDGKRAALRTVLSLAYTSLAGRAKPTAGVAANIEVFTGWSEADADAAFAEGWNINECGDGQLVILRDSDAETDLADNLAAYALVERRAAEGSDLHMRALALVLNG